MHPGTQVGIASTAAPRRDAPWGAASPGTPVPPRTGAFSLVHSRWLVVWAVLGGVLLSAGAAVLGRVVGGSVPDELVGILLYLPVAAWVIVMVGGRARVDLRVMLRWPRLGAYWWLVAGMLVVQLLFSLGAVTLTRLVAPGLDDALAGVGQGNLLLAVIGLVILPPLVEEVVFRGALLERFAVKWNLVAAILVAAALFGILHADPVGAGMFGVVTALLYLRTGSLWPGILIHLANNLIALTAMRLSASDFDAPTPQTGEALASAAVFLALSVPFLLWFLITHWPHRGQPTPYQAFEMAHGLPERHADGLAWSGAPGRPLRLTATASHLVVGAPGPRPEPLAVLPLEAVRSVYPSPTLGGEQVVIVLHDGTWTSMQVQGGSTRANRDLARIVAERAEAASRVARPT